MTITLRLTPVRLDGRLEVVRKGDVLEFNGIACDLSHGETCDWMQGTAEKTADGWQVTKPAPPVVAPRAPGIGVFNETSLELLEPVQLPLRSVMIAARREIVFDVIEGLRTIERQRELVAQGASRTMNSRHLTGHAVDVWPIDPVTDRRVHHANPKERDRLLWVHLRRVAEVVKMTGNARFLASGLLITKGPSSGCR